MKNQNLELILTFLGIQFIDYKGKRTSNGHVTAKTIGEIKKFFGKEVMTSGQSINQIKWWDFENDWNDLMFLIEKIESLGFKSNLKVSIDEIDFEFYNKKINVGMGAYKDDLTKKEVIYRTSLRFIEWYNKQNK